MVVTNFVIEFLLTLSRICVSVIQWRAHNTVWREVQSIDEVNDSGTDLLYGTADRSYYN